MTTDAARTAARTARVLAALLLIALGALAGPARPAQAAPRVPAVPAGLPVAIEPQHIDYQAQVSCAPAFRPGTAALARLLAATYPGVTVQGAYGCGSDGTVSEHYEGRAIDWMTSVRNPAQRANADAFVGWLLATDRAGNRFAMARRLGVQYIIWNNRIWGGWSGRWEPYGSCARTPKAAYDNGCHRTHVHLSLTWNGAMGRTSFWSKRVPATDFGPCRVPGLNWAPKYSGYNPRGCPRVAAPVLPRAASPALRSVWRWSGAVLGAGSTGPAVAAVQPLFGVAATGNYQALTRTRVAAWQRAHRLPASGTLDQPTWRALLATLGYRG